MVLGRQTIRGGLAPLWVRLCLLMVVGTAGSAVAVTPESPEVRRLVGRGLEFLESQPAHSKLGGKCLVGLALLKNGADPDHPKVLEAIEASRQLAKPAAKEINTDIYSTGLAVIFLCSLDPGEHSAEIKKYLESLALRQKSHGGWGYAERETGDTSMTQYGVLSAWEAQEAGFKVEPSSVERVANWLLRTQDPTGAWGYQGNDPGHFQLVSQTEVRESMVCAGLGSTLICAHMLGLIDFRPPADDSLPQALELVADPKDPQQAAADNVDPQRLSQAVQRAMRWMQANYRIDPPQHTHYYLYALERAMSFSELAEGKHPKEPSWYNDGVAFLAGTQQDNGSWGRSDAIVDTSFAVLFLLRSTKKSIEKSGALGEGTLTGGRGLPRNLVDVQLKRGRIVGGDANLATEEMVRILQDPTHPDYDFLVENPSELSLSRSGARRRDDIQRLEKIARSGAPEARRAAIEALGRSGEMDVVPTLIFGLSDPDPLVALRARDALRFVSRRFDGVGMVEKPNVQQRLEGIKKWKAWYLTVLPDWQFDE